MGARGARRWIVSNRVFIHLRNTTENAELASGENPRVISCSAKRWRWCKTQIPESAESENRLGRARCDRTTRQRVVAVAANLSVNAAIHIRRDSESSSV